MKSLQMFCLVFLATVFTVHGQPFAVDSMISPACGGGTRTSLDTSLTDSDITRGVASPCTGYLQWDGVRLCGEANSFYNSAAKRACYTLGCNMDRGSGLNVMLWNCLAYREDGLDLVSSADSVFNVKSLLTGKHGFGCESGGDYNCFDQCHFDGTTPFPETGNDCGVGEPYWAITATDINECENGMVYDCKGPAPESCSSRKACGDNTYCTNKPGSYICECESGHEERSGDPTDPYYLDQGCIDIDECDKTLYPDTCGDSGHCVNTPGSYFCVCPLSHLWDDTTKECNGPMCPPATCDPNAYRPQVEGAPDATVTYTCLDGYETDDGSTSYTSTCTDGVWSDKFLCKDVDECTVGGYCDVNADCTNIPGSAICKCRAGFTGDGKTCTELQCGRLPDITHATTNVFQPPTSNYGDEITFTCDAGYRVSIQNLAFTTIDSNGFTATTSFTLRCGSTGWLPTPIPTCVPVVCGDPGTVDNSLRTGSVFNYNEIVTYECAKGYRPTGAVSGETAFTRTCQADGTWTSGKACEDIDECDENSAICGSGQYCINMGGSYTCTCVPWHEDSPNDGRCVDWAGLIEFPKYRHCNIMYSLGLCQSGSCDVVDGKAKCACEDGWTGAACSTRIYDTGVVMGIVALIVIFLLIIILLAYMCHHYYRYLYLATPVPVRVPGPPPPPMMPPMGPPMMGPPMMGPPMMGGPGPAMIGAQRTPMIMGYRT